MTNTTVNPCRQCAPLGASLVFHGLENTICLLHGSQGCSTYIRRYIISHFKEPLDIASSNFSEDTAIFGGAENLKRAIRNMTSQYRPEVIGIATTCLSETIGEDVAAIIDSLEKEWNPETEGAMPRIIHAATPSYQGSHIEGFHTAVKAIVSQLADTTAPAAEHTLAIFPGFISPADIRSLKSLAADFGFNPVILPDYSDTLDGPLWSEYQSIPPGGTPVRTAASLPNSQAAVEFTSCIPVAQRPGAWLSENHSTPLLTQRLPIGIHATDSFLAWLSEQSGNPIPEHYTAQRGRLVDAYADAHKYLFERRAILYGEEDLVVALALFMREIGIIPVLCASGGESKSPSHSLPSSLDQTLRTLMPDFDRMGIRVLPGADFDTIEKAAAEMEQQTGKAFDLAIGNSKGYKFTSRMNIPLLRAGFPVHDRFGASRQQLLGYEGTQRLFDTIVNLLLDRRQSENPVGYSYL